MIFVDSGNVDHTTPPNLLTLGATGFFIIVRDPSWTFPVFTNWDIEFSTSPNNATWGPWAYGVTVPSSQRAYNYINNIDITLYYQFRYKCRSRLEVSAYSAATVAGRPLVAGTTTTAHTGTPPGGTAQAAGVYGFEVFTS